MVSSKTLKNQVKKENSERILHNFTRKAQIFEIPRIRRLAKLFLSQITINDLLEVSYLRGFEIYVLIVVEKRSDASRREIRA